MSTGPSSPKSQNRMKSKLSSLFTQKASHWSDFRIELDYPVKTYGPGDSVKGTVILNVTRPLGITHIVLCLYGYVRVFKTPSKPKFEPRVNGSYPHTSRGGRWTTEYYGDGYASLFQEEIVICGGGRLDPNLLHFRFELRFPKGGVIPSSIDFERGTISYNLQATITRPTAISPTASCDRKIFYRDEIDVGRIDIPKPFEFGLEPIHPSSQKAKSHAKHFAATHGKRKRTSPLSKTDTDLSSRTNTSTTTRDEDRSQRPNTPSAASSHSKSSGRIRDSEPSSDRRSSQASQSPKDAGYALPKQKMIDVSIQLGKAACLAGEFVPLTISIKHTKPVKSLSGVVVTLYRQAGVDLHPNLPIGPKEGNGKTKYEDYYPRSRTGLGGLSLSAAGSSQMWRKDLSQTVKPLIIDPETLSTEIKLSVPVPDDAFPSIHNVPGDMISFKYHIEVIIDMQGKLAHSGSFPSLGLTGTHAALATSQILEKSDDSGQVLTMWEGGCIDTIPIRREKSVMTCIFDLIIGTRDSQRSKGKQRAVTITTPEESISRSGMSPTNKLAPSAPNGTREQFPNAEHNEYQNLEYPPNGYHNGYYEDYYYNYDYGYDYGYGYDPYFYPQQPSRRYQNQQNYAPVPRPPVQNEDHLTEKQRLELAEQRLFPSQPPVEYGSSSAILDLAPSAPIIPEESDPIVPESALEATPTRATHSLDTITSILETTAPQQEDSLWSEPPLSSANQNRAEGLPALGLAADRIAIIDHASTTADATDGQRTNSVSVVEGSEEDHESLSAAVGGLSISPTLEALPRYER